MSPEVSPPVAARRSNFGPAAQESLTLIKLCGKTTAEDQQVRRSTRSFGKSVLQAAYFA